MVAAGLLALVFFPFVLARPASPSTRLVVRDHRTAPPAGFHPTGKVLAPGGMLRLTVSMPQGNITGLHDVLMDVSDPMSVNYGRHLSKAEVEALVAPKAESVAAVKGWLRKNDITPSSSSPSGDLLNIDVPVEKANALLNADFKSYVHEGTKTMMTRTLSYSIPANLHEHVAYIYPTTQFLPPTKKLSFKAVEVTHPLNKHPSNRVARRDVGTACEQGTTPECLQLLYNIPTTPASASGSGLAVNALNNELADPNDLKQFLSQFRPDNPNQTFAIQSIDNGVTSGPGTGELSLDIQYTVGLATNVPVTLFSLGSEGQSDLDEVNFLLQQETPPQVLTTSFGSDEPDDPAAQPILQTICNAYAQLGARGISVLFASGDGGVSGGQPNDSCDNGGQFIRTFPSGCPFVTSVGSTQGIAPETAASFSSGGFSTQFPRPAYQDAAVETYLRSLGSTNAGRFNSFGRAYPDVSTQGVNFPVVLNGQTLDFFGTSASSPTFASIVALVNDRLLSAGRAPLGFLNPFLYANGANAFSDITSGSNPGCGTDGFPALPGWDPVTGLGTPDFTRLLAIAIGGQDAGGQVGAGNHSTGTIQNLGPNTRKPPVDGRRGRLRSAGRL